MSLCYQFVDFQQVLFGDIDKGINVTQGIHEIFVVDRFIFLRL